MCVVFVNFQKYSPQGILIQASSSEITLVFTVLQQKRFLSP